ncbi:MAG: hypothetical protein ABIJ18_00320 [archaeon]
MDKRGVFFSIDAIIALLAAIILISMIFVYLGQLNVKDATQNELLEYSRSVFTVMEKGDYLEGVVDTGSLDNVSSFFNNFTKDSVCFNLTIYDSSLNDLNLGKLKDGCSISEEKVVVRRSFIYGENVYLAKMEAHYE